METRSDIQKAPLWPLLVFGAVAIIVTSLRAGPALGGDLLGNDDMLRMQQVRDLLSGDAGWFDVDQKRLLTSDGGAMHWSRLPDLFIAGIVFLFQPLIGRASAEGLAATIWPLLQLGWVFAALTVSLRRLGATLSGQLAGMFFFCVSFAIINFLPGRVDHHGLGLALTLTAFACLLSERKTGRSAIIAGFSVAAMLTVAIENLPAAAFIIGAFGMAWIVRGEAETNRLRFFGATLVVATLVAYIFDAPGAGGARGVCDALGQSHFVALLVAGAGMFAIATAMPSTRDWRSRFILLAIAGTAAAISFVVVNPGCLGDPYAGMPEEVQTGWLNLVGEARSMGAVFADSVADGLFYYGFALAGLGCAIFALVKAPAGLRFVRAALVALCTFALLIAMWQLRGTILSHSAAAIAAGLVFGELFSRWLNTRGTPAALALFAGALVISPLGWRLPALLAPPPADDTKVAAADCKSAESYRTIAAAPRMIVFTPIDLGAPLIYHTRHYATAAPYHRNAQAIQTAISVFTGPTEEARQKIARTGATHILYCPGLNELEGYAKRSPDGFAPLPPEKAPSSTRLRSTGIDARAALRQRGACQI
mgnify:CR=1 FL=1